MNELLINDMNSCDFIWEEWEEYKGDIPFWQHIFCGSIAGITEHVSMYPIDTIKTYIQTNKNMYKNINICECYINEKKEIKKKKKKYCTNNCFNCIYDFEKVKKCKIYTLNDNMNHINRKEFKCTQYLAFLKKQKKLNKIKNNLINNFKNNEKLINNDNLNLINNNNILSKNKYKKYNINYLKRYYLYNNNNYNNDKKKYIYITRKYILKNSYMKKVQSNFNNFKYNVNNKRMINYLRRKIIKKNNLKLNGIINNFDNINNILSKNFQRSIYKYNNYNKNKIKKNVLNDKNNYTKYSLYLNKFKEINKNYHFSFHNIISENKINSIYSNFKKKNICFLKNKNILNTIIMKINNYFKIKNLKQFFENNKLKESNILNVKRNYLNKYTFIYNKHNDKLSNFMYNDLNIKNNKNFKTFCFNNLKDKKYILNKDFHFKENIKIKHMNKNMFISKRFNIKNNYENIYKINNLTNFNTFKIILKKNANFIKGIDNIKNVSFFKSTNINTSNLTEIIKTKNNSFLKTNIFNLYKGVNIVVLGCIPAHALYFSTFEYSKKYLSNIHVNNCISYQNKNLYNKNCNENTNNIDISKIQNFKLNINYFNIGLSSILATLAHDLILTPIDTLKQRFQLGINKSYFEYIKILQENGIRSLYLSFPITLLMNIPYQMIMICTNEKMKNIYFTYLYENNTFKKNDKIEENINMNKNNLEIKNNIENIIPNTEKINNKNENNININYKIINLNNSNNEIDKKNPIYFNQQKYINSIYNNENNEQKKNNILIHDIRKINSDNFRDNFKNTINNFNNIYYEKPNLYSQKNKNFNKNINYIMSYFLCAGIGGGIAAVLTNPLDVIKTRIQTQELNKKKKTLFKYVTIIYKQEGFKTFFNGSLARMMLCIPSAAISWGSYETMKYFFKIHMNT